MRLKNPTWAKVGIAWSLLLGSAAAVFIQLASGYSATLPIIGRVPGPPSESVVRSMDMSVFLMLSLIVLLSAPVLARGTWLKRTAVAIPVLTSVWMLVFNFVERVLKCDANGTKQLLIMMTPLAVLAAGVMLGRCRAVPMTRFLLRTGIAGLVVYLSGWVLAFIGARTHPCVEPFAWGRTTTAALFVLFLGAMFAAIEAAGMIVALSIAGVRRLKSQPPSTAKEPSA